MIYDATGPETYYFGSLARSTPRSFLSETAGSRQRYIRICNEMSNIYRDREFVKMYIILCCAYRGDAYISDMHAGTCLIQHNAESWCLLSL